MDLSAQKEKFSDAYLMAIAATVGCSTAKPDPDDDSIDWTLSSRVTGVVGAVGTTAGAVKVRSPKVDIQLKCTATKCLQADYLSFPLKLKNYDDLRAEDVAVPRILIIVLVPEFSDDWVTQTEAEICLRYCGYWVSLRGSPVTTNTTNVKIQVPRQNQFTVQALQAIMQRLAQGCLP